MIILFSLVIFLPAGSRGEDSFYPEAKETLEGGQAWVHTTFKNTMAETVFRAWYPYPAEKVWEVLIDTNHWKNIYSTYTDSRTLDKNQFDLVSQKKPTHAKAFYELVGQQIFPSELNRKKGDIWTSYVFQRLNLPWPIADRWNVMKIKNDESKESRGQYHYAYKMSVGNLKALKGYWELLPIADKPGWTEFRGEYKTDPGIIYPHFFAKTMFRATLRKDVESVIRILRSH